MPIVEYVKSKIAEDLDPEMLTRDIEKRCNKSMPQVYTELRTKAAEDTLAALAAVLGVSVEDLEAMADVKPESEPKEGMKPEGQSDDEDTDENKPTEDKKQKDFEACVSEKIPALVAEGKPQDQAVAMAISMCQEEGKCQLDLITKENIDYIKNAYIKAEEDPMNKPPATKIPDGTQEIAESEVFLQTLVSLIGEMNNKLTALLEVVGQKPQPVEPTTDVDDEPKDEGGSATPAEGASENTEEDEEQVKAFYSRVNAMLKDNGY